MTSWKSITLGTVKNKQQQVAAVSEIVEIRFYRNSKGLSNVKERSKFPSVETQCAGNRNNTFMVPNTIRSNACLSVILS